MFHDKPVIIENGNYEYFLRRDNENTFECNKMLNGIPMATYRLKRIKKKKIICSCPSGMNRGYCKHIDWLRTKLEGGKL